MPAVCVGVLTLEPPAEATLGIPEWVIAAGMTNVQQVPFLRKLSLPRCVCLGVWLLGLPHQAAAAHCTAGSGLA